MTRRHQTSWSFARVIAMVSLVLASFALTTCLDRIQAAEPDPWPAEKVNAWAHALPWLVGCNYAPSTAINQLEMWQADT
jgi:hypothetical protein